MDNQVILTATYGEFRDTLKDELQKSAEGFVRIGYLLKVARDSDILKDSAYDSVNDFAKEEFGLTKDQVSRFIAINERFSEGGNSERLEAKYAAFGYAKLTEILTLPDEVIEVLSPEMTRREIQDVKKEIKEEEKISDMEVLLEGQKVEQKALDNLQRVLHQYFYEQREQFLKMAAVITSTFTGGAEIEEVLNTMAPSGIAVKTVRIQGIGRMMLSFKGRENNIELLNTRSNEKEEYSWSVFITQLQELYDHKAGKKEWTEMYGEPFDIPKEIPKVAPVQQIEEEKEPEEEKSEKMGQPEETETSHEESEMSQEEENEENGTQKSLHDIDPEIPAPEPLEPETEESDSKDEETEESEEDGTMNEQIPGQDTVENNKEWMPENNPDIIDADFREVGTKSEENETQIDENEHFESENGTISANSDNNSAETDTKLIFEEETQTDEERPQMMAMIELIQQEIDKLRDNVDAERWEQALMDLENIQFKINKAKDMEEMEEDE